MDLKSLVGQNFSLKVKNYFFIPKFTHHVIYLADDCRVYRKELNHSWECNPAYTNAARDTQWYLPGWRNGTERPSESVLKGKTKLYF